MNRVWFFDLDGTLADTDGDIRAAWKAALRDLNVSCPDFDERFVAGPPIDDMARMLFGDIADDCFVSRLRTLFGRHYDGDGFPNTFEYPGVLARVRELAAAGDRLFIVTNKRWAGATAMMRRFGWGETFERLYTGDMYALDPAIGKLSKGELLGRVIAEHGFSRDRCTMVGDTRGDFEAARECGIDSVAVAWGYGTVDELRLATRIARTPGEI